MCVDIVFFKQKTAYEVRISDWSSDVCSSDLEKRRVLQIGRDVVDRRRDARCVFPLRRRDQDDEGGRQAEQAQDDAAPGASAQREDETGRGEGAGEDRSIGADLDRKSTRLNSSH